jgi:hypothetical protein
MARPALATGFEADSVFCLADRDAQRRRSVIRSGGQDRHKSLLLGEDGPGLGRLDVTGRRTDEIA